MPESAEFTFTGIGTSWCILTDEPISGDVRSEILEFMRVFNERFSRFLPTSEANAYRSAGSYSISDEFALLLSRADLIRTLTRGRYDPAVGALLERAGYDSSYRMVPQDDVQEFVLPQWSLNGNTLTTNGPAVFDLGGMGKGYGIDAIAAILERCGHKHYLVDGGGDIYATTKRDKPWDIAIEYPGKPDMAAGMVQLSYQGLAVSDSFRRRWQQWHHLVDPYTCAPVATVVGAIALAGSAWDADCATSALFFAGAEAYPSIAQTFGCQFLVFREDGAAQVSSGWKGELFV